ncbi:MAG: LPS-assembly protein LptD [Tatlockia sp.]|nr:LPS-assembly protein LptD [Tatlockia sp.]
MISPQYLLAGLSAILILGLSIADVVSYAAEVVVEPVQACVIARNLELTDTNRTKIADCLGWQNDKALGLCGGSYSPILISPLAGDEIRIQAKEVSFYREGRSELSGNVEVQQQGQIVNAQTAYVYRDAKTNQVSKIELLGKVQYLEAGRLMIARKAIINPQDKSGKIEDVLYRFNLSKRGAILPSWGRASQVERFANSDYLLQKATYTTCAPQDNAWQIEADSIKLDSANSRGVARNAKLYIRKWPVLYLPYLSFPTSKERKSGFLMPIAGSSNVGGFDLAIPYYWNIAPNYDATLTPHLYTKRGLMFEGQYRHLTANSFSTLQGRFIAMDRAYKNFLNDNQTLIPGLNNKSTNRWSLGVINSTSITRDLHLGINFQQVSDDYFLQDFSTNFAILTERQLLRQADLSYTTNHWFFKGMVQSYQTLHPNINDTPVADIYQRLPQLMAHGSYDELPFNSNFSILGQFDYFKWPANSFHAPDGSRYHLNPILSVPLRKPWGYITPAVELVENYYDLSNRSSPGFNLYSLIPEYRIESAYYYIFQNPFVRQRSLYNLTVPRYSIDSGLYFDRSTTILGKNYLQTLEPRLYYLKVPYHNQTSIPVFDSAYMIFNMDQLFRTNRFSGFDRIGDTNQLSYALTSRWLSSKFGGEKANLSLGQIRYFADRRVVLCQNTSGYCQENPLFLGYISPKSKSSPFVSRGEYHFNPNWIMAGDYAWDPNTSSTNNGHVNFHYEAGTNKILNAGYSYLVNGDVTQVAYSPLQNNALHQLTFSFAWPFSERWSTLGGYNYNLSKRYEMMSFAGVQYDNCCWAVRLIGGRAFRSLDLQQRPHYNNNFYLQILLKGLGAVGNSDPSSRIRTFIPSYNDSFHNY